MDKIVAETDTNRRAAGGSDEWWRGAVVYQVYPRSYQDSNGDGIGDLRGITSRLPYIASLGVDAVWLSPIFESPMKDFGYDVSDYRSIAPEFGTLSDLAELLREAHGLGLKVMLDLVLSHTSDQHSWFRESSQSRTNSKADWYVWSDPAPDGLPPNNWLSVFGGPAWSWSSTRRQYYLHNFLSSQPDLNFHNPDVQNALLEIVAFWLDLGVDGFRLDTINFYFCDRQFRSNPPLPAELRNASIAPEVNPYNFQHHIYDKNRPENLKFLERLRTTSDKYPDRAILGEVGDAQRGLEISGEYTSGSSRVHMCYSFEFLSGGQPSAQRVAETLQKAEEVAQVGWISWAFSNHDVQRHASRWDLSPQKLKMFATLLVCMRGSACVYQGEELGLPEATLRFEDLRDPYGIEFWPKFKGRDGCRTPMVWERAEPNGGFGSENPWLPVPDEHRALAVSEQNASEDSILNHYREVLALRRKYSVLKDGNLSGIAHNGDALSFIRSGSGTAFCAFNFGASRAQLDLPDGAWLPVTMRRVGEVIERTVDLRPFEALIATKR